MTFPWGDRSPKGGYKIGDYIGLIYSDHDRYVFDNPTGVITAINEEQERVTVIVSAQIGFRDIYLIARPKPGQTIMPDGEIKPGNGDTDNDQQTR